MGIDPLSGWGLRPVQLADQPLLHSYFQSIDRPLSDYTFSQLFSWSNSLRILWKLIDGNLCVFANGGGDLTLLLPPIGDSGGDRALAECWELMHTYNGAAGCPQQTRVEYASEQLLARFDRSRLDVAPMGVDYLYDVARMIDLAGGDLASKRQLKNRFMRNYEFVTEAFDPSRHVEGCLALLNEWKEHQDASHVADPSLNSLKRAKEAIATQTSILNARALGYAGLVVYVKEKPEHLQGQPPRWEGFKLRGFTFGERLGRDQASIVIEKTDLQVKGLAQYIYSEFCSRCFSDRPFINAGDDWGLQSLAWTKMSYRPVDLLQKFSFRQMAVPQIAVPATVDETTPVTVRVATADDVDAAVAVEQASFETYCLSKRQIQYLRATPTAVFLVGEDQQQVVGQAIGLVKHHKRGLSGRLYSLAVKPECRGRQIGRQLLERMIQVLVERGVGRIYLEVQQDNLAAVRLYERAGFTKIGILPDYYGEGKDGLHMMYHASVNQRVAA